MIHLRYFYIVINYDIHSLFTDGIRYALTLLSKSGKITTFRHYNCAILTFLIENVNKHTIFRTIFKALACEL